MSFTTPLPDEIPLGSIVDCYLRDSGGPRQEASTAQQMQEIKDYCKKHGLVFRTAYVDAARTGKTTAERENFLRMMAYYETPVNRPVALLLWNYARFARNMEDSQYYKIIIRKQYKVAIHSISDPVPKGKYERLIELSIDISNEEKVEQVARDASRGLHDLVRNHGCVPGVPPTGLIRKPVNIGFHRDNSKRIAHRWEPNPEYILRIQTAFEMRAEGKTLSQIQKATKLFGSINSYKTFFTNKIYIGILEFGKLTIPDYCKPMIDRKTWEAVQRIVERNAVHRNLTQSQHHPTRHIDTYLLSGIALCTRCESVLVGMTSGQRTGKYYYRYACSKAKRGGTCDLTAIPARTVESKVIETIGNFLEDPNNLEQLFEHQRLLDKNVAAQQQIIIKDIQKKITPLRRDIARITAAIRAHGHSKSLLRDLDRLESEETELENDLMKLKSETPTPIPNLSREDIIRQSKTMHEKIQSKDPTEQRAVLRYLLFNVKIDRDKTNTYLNINFRAIPNSRPRSPKASKSIDDDENFAAISSIKQTAYVSPDTVGALPSDGHR